MGLLSKEENDKIIEDVKCETILAMEKANHSMDRIAKELADIAYSDIKQHFTVNEGGEIILKPLTGRKTRAIKEIEETTNIAESADGKTLFKRSKVKIKLYDKEDALKFSASLMGMVKPQKMELTGANGGPIKITDITDDELLTIARGGSPGVAAPKKGKK
jgi:CMP-2-keto-3-deoxyoctulosonic acid synthetase